MAEIYLCGECASIPGFSGRIYINVSTPEKNSAPESRNVKTLWAAGKMFRYQRWDFLSLIMEFSDEKLKQKGLFHSVSIVLYSVIERKPATFASLCWLKASISIPLFSFSSYGIISFDPELS
jgi:hypothetical protein